MREIKIEKISLNIGVGKPGEELEKAVKLLGIITGAKPVKTSAKRRIPTWGLRPGLQIGTKVTIRGIKSVELLRELLKAKNNTLSVKNFDGGGNFSFGIHEYLDIPSIKYDPSIGIIGLEVAVTLVRPGYSIKLRRIRRRKIGARHLIKREEAIEFMKKNFGITIMENEQ